jgi:hypothetical protein
METDFAFSWGRSGKQVYFERTFRGAKNIRRMTVGPLTRLRLRSNA